jgi:serine/threonine protein kinase
MVVHTTSKEVFAMKILDKDTIKKEDLISNLKKEISIMMLISHPNVVKLIEVLASKTKIYIVLEYIKGGELWHLISNFC